MSYWSNSQYFPKSRTLLFTKINGVLSYICREFSEVTSHLTRPNYKKQSKVSYSCSRMSNSISKNQKILINIHFSCKLAENNKMELEEYLIPVSCMTSQLGARPCVCFRKIIGNECFFHLLTRKVRRFFH